MLQVPLCKDEEGLQVKSNCWRVDMSQITEKMMRRHFKSNTDLLCSTDKDQSEDSSESYSLKPSSPPQKRDNVKFSSPFSIESLLKRESFVSSPTSSPLAIRPTLNIAVKAEPQPWRAERAMKRCLSWDSPPVEAHLAFPAGHTYSMYTADGDRGHGFIDESSAKRMRVCAEPPFPVYTRASAPNHFSSSVNCYRNTVHAYVYHNVRL